MSRITERYAQGHIVFGTYASFGSAREIEALAAAGLDFVRIDGHKLGWSDDVVREMVRACHAQSLTPWARTDADPAEIARYIRLGVEALTVPSVASAEAARAIVAAAAARPDDFLIGCQVESREGLAHLDDIVRVPGVDMIHSGRTDLAADLGLEKDQFGSEVLAAEERIVAAAQREGRIVALFYPLGPQGEEFVLQWVARGVRVFALDNDARVLREEYQRTVTRLRRQDT